jgi:hypothetical protein
MAPLLRLPSVRRSDDPAQDSTATIGKVRRVFDSTIVRYNDRQFPFARRFVSARRTQHQCVGVHRTDDLQ